MCVIVLVTVSNCIDKSNDFCLLHMIFFYTITEFQSTNGCGSIWIESGLVGVHTRGKSG